MYCQEKRDKNMKTLKEIIALAEAYALNQEGPVTDEMDPSSLTDLIAYTERNNRSLQPKIETYLRDLEKRLNALGFTLGELDMSIPFDDKGSEDLIIFFKNGTTVKNVFLTMNYEKLLIPVDKSDDIPQDIREYKIELVVNEIDPYHFDEIFDPQDQGTPPSLDPVNEVVSPDNMKQELLKWAKKNTKGLDQKHLIKDIDAASGKSLKDMYDLMLG